MHSPNSSNSANSANQRPALQVVPPAALKPTTPPVSPKPTDSPAVTTQTAPTATTETSHSYANYLWFILVAIIGISCLRFITVGSTVSSSDAEIISSPDGRDRVTMPISGKIKEFLVRPNQWVESAQTVALVKSEELKKDIAEATRLNDQFQSEAALSQQQIAIMEANFKEASAKQAASHQKTESLQQQLNQGNLLPQIQELQIKLTWINTDIGGLQDELNKVEEHIRRYQPLAKQGGLALNKLEEEQKEQSKINRQIEEKKSQAEATKIQMDGLREKLQQDLRQQQVDENQSVAAVNSAMQQIKQAVANVQIRQQVATQRNKELQRVQNREQEDLRIRAGKAGYIVNLDLDKKQNQYLQAGSPLFDIVNPKQQMVEVRIKPEDVHLVKKGQLVTFRPKGRGLLNYQGTVYSIEPAASPKEPQQQPTVKVTVSLNQGQNLEQLQPGFPGDAHIEVESMFLYQKLQREFEKLVPIGKFF